MMKRTKPKKDEGFDAAETKKRYKNGETNHQFEQKSYEAISSHGIGLEEEKKTPTCYDKFSLWRRRK